MLRACPHVIGGGAGDEDELLAPLARGLVVERLEAVRVLDATQGLVTATGTGCAVVRDGRRVGAARDVVVLDAPLRLLQATQALSAATRLVASGRHDALGRPFGTVAPSLRAEGLRVLSGRGA